jgi:hypothetical protein
VCEWVLVCFIEYNEKNKERKKLRKKKIKKEKMEFLFDVTLTCR